MGGPTGSALWHLTPECLATFRTLYGITYTRIRLDGPRITRPIAPATSKYSAN